MAGRCAVRHRHRRHTATATRRADRRRSTSRPAETSVWTTFRCGSEIPNPLPGKTVAGYPVSITAGGTLDVTTHTLTDPSGAALDHVLITYKNDRYSATSPLVPKEQFYLITSSALKTSTKYVAHFAGTSGGSPIDVTFSFTTK